MKKEFILYILNINKMVKEKKLTHLLTDMGAYCYLVNFNENINRNTILLKKGITLE